jgi:hypothetical protein
MEIGVGDVGDTGDYVDGDSKNAIIDIEIGRLIAAAVEKIIEGELVKLGVKP